MYREEGEWVTVATFPQGMDLLYIEHELKENGIAYVKRDELTVQLAPHLSHAIGGVRLQVHEPDRERTLTILEEFGVSIEPDGHGSPFLLWFERVSGQLPGVRQLELGWRLLIVGGLLLAILGSAAYFMLRTDRREVLTGNIWCLDRYIIDGKEVAVGTTGYFRLVMACGETVRFDPNGSVQFPGMDSQEIKAHWYLDGSTLQVHRADTLYDLFNDSFAMDLRSGTLFLKGSRLSMELQVWSLWSFGHPVFE